jgi:hypothetical protein
MNDLTRAFETSSRLAEKIASARSGNTGLREKLALADFATFGLFKQAAIDPAALAALQKGLGWGVGLGIPMLGVGHALTRDARHQAEATIRDARNQALLTAAGVGGMQALGNILKQRAAAVPHHVNVSMMAAPEDVTPAKLAAAILVDDVLEDGYHQLQEETAKHAMLVQLVRHRSDATHLLRSLLS